MVYRGKVVSGTQSTAYGIVKLGKNLLLAVGENSLVGTVPVDTALHDCSGSCNGRSILKRNASLQFGELGS